MAQLELSRSESGRISQWKETALLSYITCIWKKKKKLNFEYFLAVEKYLSMTITVCRSTRKILNVLPSVLKLIPKILCVKCWENIPLDLILSQELFPVTTMYLCMQTLDRTAHHLLQTILLQLIVKIVWLFDAINLILYSFYFYPLFYLNYHLTFT